MASPGNHYFSFALKTGKTQSKWDQLKSLKISELHVTAAKLKVKRPRDHKNQYLITLILDKMEALPDPPDTDKYGHVLS